MSLQHAIFETVAYADVFDYPLTLDEIHRYLIGVQATRESVAAALSDHPHIACVGNLYCLPGRETVIDVRNQRTHEAKRLWPLALHYGRWIGRLPFVRMVAITGSLAVDNTPPGGDVDYFIITAPRRLWLTRLLVIALVRWAARSGITLCPNYLLSENALYIRDQGMYPAREITQMVPVAGLATYHDFRERNGWTVDYFPNAVEPPDRPGTNNAGGGGLFQRITEMLLRTPPGDWLDRWEMRRKVHKLSRDPSSEAQFSRDWCKGHFDGHMGRIMNAYQSRLERLNGSAMENNKVLFGQSYYLRFDPKLWAAMQPYPPLGTLYAAAYLRQRGYDVALFDAMLAESETEWAAALDRERPRYAVIYEDNFNYLSKMCLSRMREAALTMIDMAKQRGCTIIVCGADATDHSTVYLDGGADYVLLGEGEESLGELMDALRAGDPADSIAGVVSQTQPEGTRRPVMRCLDDLPHPAWDLIDVERYRAIWTERHGYYSMNLVTTRGCPYHCNWCAKPIWGQRYNVHSPEYVADQMKHLQATYQPDHIWFADDIMGLKPGWIERFADVLEQKNVRIPFKCLSRVDLLVRGDTVNALNRAGCRTVWVGAESGAQHVLDAMEKGTTVAQIHEAADRLHRAGIEVGFFLQFGYPGETRADIEKTLQLVRDCRPDDVGISVSYPLPGTPFYERVKTELGERQHWQDSADLAMLYAGPFSTGFYRQLHTVVHKEFRARKTFAALRHSRPRDLAAMIYHTATLPLARMRLNRLAQQPHRGIDALQPRMDYAAAATPSPQED